MNNVLDLLHHLEHNGNIHCFRRENTNYLIFKDVNEIFEVSNDLFLFFRLGNNLPTSSIKEIDVLIAYFKEVKKIERKYLDFHLSYPVNHSLIHKEIVDSLLIYDVVNLYIDVSMICLDDIKLFLLLNNEYELRIQFIIKTESFQKSNKWYSNLFFVPKGCSIEKIIQYFLSLPDAINIINIKDVYINSFLHIKHENSSDKKYYNIFFDDPYLLQNTESLNKTLLKNSLLSQYSIITVVKQGDDNEYNIVNNNTCYKCWAKNICWHSKCFITFGKELTPENIEYAECKNIKLLIENFIHYLHSNKQ